MTTAHLCENIAFPGTGNRAHKIEQLRDSVTNNVRLSSPPYAIFVVISFAQLFR